jgi:hypothetical protein
MVAASMSVIEPYPVSGEEDATAREHVEVSESAAIEAFRFGPKTNLGRRLRRPPAGPTCSTSSRPSDCRRTVVHFATYPPSTMRFSAVMNDASSEARNKMA